MDERVRHEQTEGRRMELVESILAARRACHRARIAAFGTDDLGLVAVRQKLHEGHLSLVRRAREECGVVAVVLNQAISPVAGRIASGEAEDPDAETLARAGATIVFRPLVPVFDAECATRVVTVEGGAFPAPVAMVTFFMTLLHIFSPERLYFGELDAVAFAGLRRAMRDLAMTTRLVSTATARAENGLPYGCEIPLPRQRAALAIPQAFDAVRQVIGEGQTEREAVLRAGMNVLKRQPELKLEYFEALNAESLERVDRVERGVLVAVAARLAGERLTDSFCVE